MKTAESGTVERENSTNSPRKERATGGTWEVIDFIARHSYTTGKGHQHWEGPRNRDGGTPVVPLSDGSVLPVRHYLYSGKWKREGLKLVIRVACSDRKCIREGHMSFRYADPVTGELL